MRRHPWIVLALLTFAGLWSANRCAFARERIGAPVPAEAPLVCVFGFLNPPKASTFVDLGYKLKSGQWSEPDVSDFADLGSELRRALAGKLADKLGHGTVTLVNAASGQSQPNAADDADCQKQAQDAGAKFFLNGTINHIRFQGNALIPSYYELVVSARLVSAASGEVAWKTSHNLFPHYFSCRKGESPADVFEGRLIPHIADVMSARILAVLQAEPGQSP